MRMQRLGKMHSYTLNTLFTLVSIRERIGRLNDAKALFLEVLDGREQVLGLKHAATIATADRLAALESKL